MKVAQVSYRYYSDIVGVETVMKEVSERLVQNGVDIEVLTQVRSGKYLPIESISGVTVKRSRTGLFGRNFSFRIDSFKNFFTINIWIKEKTRIGMKILDIGCGNNKFKGNKGDIVIGIDRVNLPEVDVIHDMEKFPYPFEDEEFDKVVMQHTLEHISKENMANIKIIEEIHRMLKGGGILEVEVPIGHWFKYDPTHKNYVGFWYWKYFSDDFPINFYSKARFRVLEYNLVGLAGAKFATILKPIFCWLYKKNPERMERIIDMIGLDAAIRYKLKKIIGVY